MPAPAPIRAVRRRRRRGWPRRALPALVAGVVVVPLVAACGTPTAALPNLTGPTADGFVGQHPTLHGQAANGPADDARIAIAIFPGTAVSGRPVQHIAVHQQGGHWRLPVTLAPGRYVLRATQRQHDTQVHGPDTPFTVSADPVIGAAGDIACDPKSVSFHHGAGPASGVRCQERATSQALLDTDVTAALAVGDLQYEAAQPNGFKTSFGPTWGRLGARVYPAIGNHEYVQPHPTQGYFTHFNGTARAGRAGTSGQGWYSVDIGSWHVIALNSNCRYIGGCGPGSKQLQWLQNDLATHSATCTLAFWHHARWSSGRHRDQGVMWATWDALVKAKADVVISAHDHDYERFAPQLQRGRRDDVNGIRQFVVGTGGKNLDPFTGTPDPNSETRDDSTFGVLTLALHPTSYDWRFLPTSGGTYTDSGSGTCH